MTVRDAMYVTNSVFGSNSFRLHTEQLCVLAAYYHFMNVASCEN